MDSSRFWVLVLFCSLSAIIRLFVHPLSCSLVSRVRRGLSECACGNSFSSIFVHPVDSFRGLSLREFFLHIFDS